MLILSLDTTTRAGSAAVLGDDAVLAVLDGDAARTHGERLPGELAEVLRLAGVTLQDIDLLAVARGPGAFTGLRIGLAAMQALAMVTSRPVVGVSALDAVAVTAFESMKVERARLCVWMDAARAEVFAASYDAAGSPGGVPDLVALTEAEVGAPAEILDGWQAAGVTSGAGAAAAFTFAGDGADRYEALLGGSPKVAVPALAPAIGRLGRRMALTGDHPPHALQPLYVRRPDAERAVRP